MDAGTKETLLRLLSTAAISVEPDDRGTILRALDASVSLLNARVSLPRAAQWFLDSRAADGQPDENDNFWVTHVSHAAARELREIVPRAVVLHSEIRDCNLTVNSGARWVYSALALLAKSPDQSLLDRLLEQLFNEIVSIEGHHQFAPEHICDRACERSPQDAILRIRFEYECPDVRQGFSMMRLEFDSHEEIIQIWPLLDDPDANHVEMDELSEACERLGPKHVLPMQLATFLGVLSNAKADQKESWGGEMAVLLFEDIPHVMKRREDDE